MKRRLLDLLVCPSCGGPFSVTADVEQERPGSPAGYDSEIIDGSLTCTSCRDAYPIINAIPRILDAELLARMETRYPDYFERHGRMAPSDAASNGESSPDAASDALGETLESFTRQRLDLRAPGPEFAGQWQAHLAKVLGPDVGRAEIDGRLVLDAGCGFGRHTFTAAGMGAEVVGMDLSGAVDVAFTNTQHLDRAHIVQANLYSPPFREGTFDMVWSFGVLHHLPDPREGFRSIAPLARPDGGQVAIWVYGYEGMALTYRISHLRPVRRLVADRSPATKVRVSQAIAAGLSAGYWAPLWVLDQIGFGKRIDRLPLSEQVHHGWSSRVAAVHDRVATPITHYHDRDELQDWFAELGMTDVVVEDTNRRGWRASGRRRASGGKNEVAVGSTAAASAEVARKGSP